MKPTLYVLLIAISLVAASGGQQHNKAQNIAKEEPCPDEVDTTGRYVNRSYGFSITIPKELKGVWNSARCANGPEGCVCMSDHGRIISLDKNPREDVRFIEAYAGFAAELDDPTIENAVTSRLDWIRERSLNGSVSVLERENLTLGGLRGKRVVVRYQDKKSNITMIEDFVLALRKPRGSDVEYSVYLRTTLDEYSGDKGIFESVLQSFALARCNHC